MKKIIILCLAAAVLISGCTSKQTVKYYEAKRDALKQEITNLQVELNEMKQMIEQED